MQTVIKQDVAALNNIITYPTFKPRHYQQELLDAFFLLKMKRFYFLCHRRAGKDMTCWNLMWGAALQRVGSYLYLLPQQNQARKVIWQGMIGDGSSFLTMIPKRLIRKINNTNMSIQLENGSMIFLGGANNYNAYMGMNPIGVVFSEYPLQPPQILDYLSPILVENGGWMICQGTPRGKNHAYKTFQAALQADNWFVRCWPIDATKKHDDTPVITDEQIEAERRSGVAEEIIQQEFYLSWNIGNVGAYFTQEIDDAEYDGRICDWDINPRLPVYTFWDLGISDKTAIWFLQPDGYDLKMVYYYENTGEGMHHYACKLDELKAKFGFKYKYHYAPHDVRNRQWGATTRSTLAIAAECGIHFLVAHKVSDDDGIQAAKSIFPEVWFHSKNCELGLEALRHFKREYDEDKKCFKNKPFEDWSMHCFDAFKYFATTWKEAFQRPDLMQQSKYQINF
jgi:phage terminase large subunit